MKHELATTVRARLSAWRTLRAFAPPISRRNFIAVRQDGDRARRRQRNRGDALPGIGEHALNGAFAAAAARARRFIRSSGRAPEAEAMNRIGARKLRAAARRIRSANTSTSRPLSASSSARPVIRISMPPKSGPKHWVAMAIKATVSRCVSTRSDFAPRLSRSGFRAERKIPSAADAAQKTCDGGQGVAALVNTVERDVDDVFGDRLFVEQRVVARPAGRRDALAVGADRRPAWPAFPRVRRSSRNTRIRPPPGGPRSRSPGRPASPARCPRVGRCDQRNKGERRCACSR